MLTPDELVRVERGQTLKRLVRSRAAWIDIYDDASLSRGLRAHGYKVSSLAIGRWWEGHSVPKADSLVALADLLDLNPEELIRYMHVGGPAPTPLATPPADAARIDAKVQEAREIVRARTRSDSPLPEGRVPRRA